jgi:hypothetical protein
LAPDTTAPRFIVRETGRAADVVSNGMSKEVKLGNLKAELETISYPVSREEATAAFDDVV